MSRHTWKWFWLFVIAITAFAFWADNRAQAQWKNKPVAAQCDAVNGAG